MERTPWPEMGQEQGRRQSVNRVSTPPFLQVLQVHKTVLFLYNNSKQYLLRRSLPIYVVLYLHEFIVLDLES